MGDDRAQDAKGKAKEKFGNLSGNEDLQRKGRSDQAKASVKDKIGNVIGALRGKKR